MSIKAASCLSLIVLCAACASFSGSSLRPGLSDQADTRRQMGEPTAIHRAPPQAGYAESWEYSRGSGGRQTFMVRFDQFGRVLRTDQVRQEATLQRIRFGVDNMQAVQDLLGRPDRSEGVSRAYGGPTWDYFAEDHQRHVILTVTFDARGIAATAGSMMDPDEDLPSGRR